MCSRVRPASFLVFLLLTLTTFCFTSVNSYNILGVCTNGVPSHWSSCESVFLALSDAKHNVTIISMVESNYKPRPNHHVLHLDNTVETFRNYYPKDFSSIQSGAETISIVLAVGLKTTDLLMKHEKFQRFLREDHKFDLVIVESFGTDAFYGLGEHFKAPLIGLSTTMPTGWLNLAVGNSDPWSYAPNQFLQASPKMTFNDRLNNVLLNIFEYLLVTRTQIPESNEIMMNYFPDNKRSLQEIFQHDVCLGFANSHFTLSQSRPYSPNMIEIGGIHLNENSKKELTGEFKEFVESAEHGIIVFSLGSLLRASELKENQRKAFIKVFSQLKQKVIWRYNLPDADQLPNNILGREWIPQKELLAHPKARLFIGHGGMLGTTEAAFHGVPMLGIPFFGDQHVNIARGEGRGTAMKLNRHEFTEKHINDAVQELLNNPKYMKNAKDFAIAYKDKPMTAQETVVFWSEYVVRHKCAPFLKVAGSQMSVIAFNNLDVWACLVLIALFAILSAGLLIRVICAALLYFKWKVKND